MNIVVYSELHACSCLLELVVVTNRADCVDHHPGRLQPSPPLPHQQQVNIFPHSWTGPAVLCRLPSAPRIALLSLCRRLPECCYTHCPVSPERSKQRFQRDSSTSVSPCAYMNIVVYSEPHACSCLLELVVVTF